MAASSIPEPAGRPAQSDANVDVLRSLAGLPTPIRLLMLLPPPVAKTVMQPGSKALPTKGPPPGKSVSVQAVPQKNQFFDHAVSLQQVPASPDLDDPHGSLLF
jgi:hypothetical protein